MFKLLFGLGLLFSVQTWAMNVGSKSVLAVKSTDKWGNKRSGFSEKEFLAQGNDRYQIKESYSVYEENGDLKESGTVTKWELGYNGYLPNGKRFNAQNIQLHCDYFEGTIETVTVPAGIFKACKIDYQYAGTSGSEWLGPIPFEVVKRKVHSEWNTSEYVLKNYNE